jgi:aminobenzoyl-glutamate utilization protein B
MPTAFPRPFEPQGRADPEATGSSPRQPGDPGVGGHGWGALPSGSAPSSFPGTPRSRKGELAADRGCAAPWASGTVGNPLRLTASFLPRNVSPMLPFRCPVPGRSGPRSTPIRIPGIAVAALLALSLPSTGFAQERAEEPPAALLERLLPEVEAAVLARAPLVQQIVDQVFSYSELGFQEVETSRYLVGVLREHGFDVEEGISGMPTSWWATWGSGRPVISLGSDIDGIPKASQRPGVAYHDPLVPDAPGHGEGHNSGQGVNIVAAIALKEVMEQEGLPGTLVLWPGVAEELVAAKAWFVRDGWFDAVDAALFTHVGNNFGVSWGGNRGTGLVSIEFTFHGEAAHSAGSPWRGRSALDGVELMNVGWNYWREHMRPLQRSHHVVTDGGDQPNVVPSRASVWYYVREMDYEHLRENVDAAIRMAEGAALMSDTRVEHRILGQAWPRHFNRPIAEATWAHIEAVGLPDWSDDDEALAMAVQMEVGSEPVGLTRELGGSTARRTSPRAAARTTSETSHGPSRRSRSATRRTFPDSPGTTGPTRSRWRRPSPTRARWRARGCWPGRPSSSCCVPIFSQRPATTSRASRRPIRSTSPSSPTTTLRPRT